LLVSITRFDQRLDDLLFMRPGDAVVAPDLRRKFSSRRCEMKRLLLVLVSATSAYAQKSLTVTSAFKSGGMIPSEYTCEGRGVSPPISWSAVPPDTKSVAILVDDPDAPNGTFEHLVLFNVPPSVRSLPSLSEPMSGVQGSLGRNSTGANAYAPICPPSGRHHYRFQVMALDTTLPQHAGATSADVTRAVNGHVLARGELTGVYQKR
jgi:Raf kinase inhibitor-like YbhB/YbcL family protein